MKIELWLLLILALNIIPVSAWSIPFSITKADDGYIIAGTVTSNSKQQAVLVKVDSDGKEIWNRTYTDECWLSAWSVVKVSDGYATGGAIVCHKSDGWIAKVDESGNVIWQKIYGFKNTIDGVPALTSDGDGVVAAVTIVPWLVIKVKLLVNGQILIF